jgi:hypothetical protein
LSSVDAPVAGTASDLLLLRPWLEEQPFFLLSSASAAGACDCSYRGREMHGVPEPLLHVMDAGSLVIPDYRGNNLFNSIGNLLEHDRIALLFVDFAQQCTVMIQGRAEVAVRQADRGPAWQTIFPTAPRAIFIQVSRVQTAPVADLPHLEWVAD